MAAGGTALDPEVVAQLLARSRHPLAGLTPREREVLALMAEGRSNAAIAAALVVGDGAVEKHISSIFAKLGLPPAEHDHRRVLRGPALPGSGPVMSGSPFTTKTRPAVGPLPVAEPMPMTTGRRVALAIGVPAALILIGSLAISGAGLTSHFSLLTGLRKTYQVTLAPVPVQNGAVTLQIVSGDGNFGPGRPGDDQVARVTGKARYEGRKPSFTDLSTPNGTTLQSSCSGRFPPCSVSYAVAVPAGVALHAEDTSGDLSVRHLTSGVTLQVETGDIDGTALGGPVNITDQSGDVTLGTVSGPVQISGRTGDISLQQASGPVQIGSQSGDVTLGSVAGRLRVSSQIGDVSFGSVTGPSVTVQSQSGDITGQSITSADVTVNGRTGDIYLSFTRVPTRVNVICTSGDITVRLPRGSAAYQVTTQAQHGSVSVDVPTDASSPNMISVTDGSGDISISH